MIRTCPFCGAVAHLKKEDTGFLFLYRVSCEKGHATDTVFTSPEEAIVEWNKRPQLDNIRAVVHHLKSALKHNLHSQSQYERAFTQIIELCDK